MTHVFKNKSLLCLFFTSLMIHASIFTQDHRAKTIIIDTTDNTQVLPSPAKPTGRPSVALVLSGGGARGFAHLPVLELLEELDIPIDMIIGTSAGSIIGGLYASGYSTIELKEQLLTLRWSSIFQDGTTPPYEQNLGDHSRDNTPFALQFNNSINQGFSLALGQGLLTGQYAYDLFKRMTIKIPSDTDFDTLSIPFRAVTVDLLSGNLHVITHGDIAEAIRSSISIPAFFQPFALDDLYLIDGGTRDNTPIDVAKKMGYDIIIVSEISDALYTDIETFDSNPGLALRQMINLEQAVKNRNYFYDQANLVMYPDYGKKSILDFDSAQEIYDTSKSSIDQYRVALQELRKEIFTRQPEATASATSQKGISYDERTPIYLTNISIDGATASQKRFITKKFTKIKNRILTPEDISIFSKEIYRTGLYTSVNERILTSDNGDTLYLRVRQKRQEETVVMMGFSDESSFAQDSTLDFAVYADIQRRNLSGQGSVFSIRGSVINDARIECMYLQPITPFAYIKLDGMVNEDSIIRSSGFDSFESDAIRISKQTASLSIGIPVFNWLTLSAGSSFNWYDTGDVYDGGGKAKTTDIFGSLTCNTLDYPIFPSSGIEIAIKNTSVLPITQKDGHPIFDILTCDTTAAIPITHNLSLVAGGYGRLNFDEYLDSYPELFPIYGSNFANRKYFPQVGFSNLYGLNMYAVEGGIQFAPWDHLTIVGGKAFTAITGAYGAIWDKKANINKEESCWRASFDMGIRITNAFGILVRIGAGKSCDKTSPFISLDIGKIRL